MLDKNRVKRFYDAMGSRQDAQAFYEKKALNRLIENGGFEEALAVVELGCGTGRFARELLGKRLPPGATYFAFDVSSTMVELTRRKLAEFGDRASVVRISGEPRLPLIDGSCDRFISNYVLDLLPDNEIRAFIAEAHRVLRPGGRLGLVSIAPGRTFISKVVMELWAKVHRLHPILVGGCRPIEILAFLGQHEWSVIHHEVMVSYGLSSEIVVAERS